MRTAQEDTRGFVRCPIFGTASRATFVDLAGGAMLGQQLSPGDQSDTVATLAIAADPPRTALRGAIAGALGTAAVSTFAYPQGRVTHLRVATSRICASGYL